MTLSTNVLTETIYFSPRTSRILTFVSGYSRSDDSIFHWTLTSFVALNKISWIFEIPNPFDSMVRFSRGLGNIEANFSVIVCFR